MMRTGVEVCPQAINIPCRLNPTGAQSLVADRKGIFLKVDWKPARKLSTERAGIAPALAVCVAREGNYSLPDCLKLSRRHCGIASAKYLYNRLALRLEPIQHKLYSLGQGIWRYDRG